MTTTTIIEASDPGRIRARFGDTWRHGTSSSREGRRFVTWDDEPELLMPFSEAVKGADEFDVDDMMPLDIDTAEARVLKAAINFVDGELLRRSAEANGVALARDKDREALVRTVEWLKCFERTRS